MRRNLLIVLFVILANSPLFAIADDLASVLDAKLKDKFLNLRVPIAGLELRYSELGELQSRQSHGLRSLDGMVRVTNIELHNDILELKGNRFALLWDEKGKKLAKTKWGNPVRIKISLRHGANITEGDIAPALNKIFLTGRELADRECSEEEQRNFFELAINGVKTKREKQDVDPKSIACFPLGDRFERIRKDLTLPHVVQAPDPEYSPDARRRRVQGTVLFLVGIDEKGYVADAILTRSVDPGLNLNAIQVLRDWRFQPALRDGEPVPTVVNVEVNFRLY